MSQKNKKRGKNQKSRNQGQTRDILFAEDDQLYATVEKMLGNCRVLAQCADGKSRICHIRGKMKKRIWVREDSTILVALRQFEDDKADVIHCYLPEEVRRLKAYGELPDLKETDTSNQTDIMWEDSTMVADEPELSIVDNTLTDDNIQTANNEPTDGIQTNIQTNIEKEIDDL